MRNVPRAAQPWRVLAPSHPKRCPRAADLKAQSRQAHAAAKRVRPHAVPRAGVPEFSADDILDKAEELMETGQYELASRFCDKILAGDAENARALETKALACLELTQVPPRLSPLPHAVVCCLTRPRLTSL